MSAVLRGLFLRVDAPTPDEPHAEDFDDSDEFSWFCRVIAFTEMSAHHNEIDGCAACRSTKIPRTPFSAPEQLGVMTAREGIRYGYLLCKACRDKSNGPARAGVLAAVDANFDGVGAA